MELVSEHYVNYIDLKNGKLDLLDLLNIHDACTIKAENKARIQDYFASQRPR